MAIVLEKDLIKDALRELMNEEPATFKTFLREILIEEQAKKEIEFENFLDKNFERFDETFRALA
ncbi:MAG: hypothetical protein V4683_14580 [Bacteroidota bacterium]